MPRSGTATERKARILGLQPEEQVKSPPYCGPGPRSFPGFTQIDMGAAKGSRRLIVVEGLDKTSEAYIVHANATTWKKPGSDNRITLTPACPEGW